MYCGSIRVIEEDIHLWRSMLALLRIKWAASELHKLRQERDELQKQVRLLVEEWGPKYVLTLASYELNRLHC
jgi:cell division protein FtsB